MRKLKAQSPYLQSVKPVAKKQRETEEDQVGKEQQSRWIEALTQEGNFKPPEAEEVPTPSKDARVQRLWKMFEESEPEASNSDKDLEDRMDMMAAKENMDDFMARLDNHLDAEKALIVDWQNKVYNR